MSRRSYLPTAVAFFAAAVFWTIGCGKSGSPGPATIQAKPPTVSVPRPSSDKLFANWPTPLAAVIFSGELDGYLEPCGCTEGQLGGLGRRFDLLERLQKQGWSVAQVDLGGVVHEPVAARGGLKQSLVKYTVALRAFTAMNYDVLVPGVDDLKLGVGELLGQYVNLSSRPKIVCANLTGQGGTDLPFLKSLVVKTGSIAIGVTAVLDPNDLKPLLDAADWLESKPAESAAAEALLELEKTSDVQVLLVQGSAELATKIAQANPGFDLVQARSPHADPDAVPILLNDGRTMLVQIGKKGKYVGVVGIFDDPKDRFKYQRVSLNAKYANAETIRKLIEDDYQGELKEMKLVEEFPQRTALEAAPGATYIGAEACKSCHPNTFATWQSTPHAHAFDSLSKPGKRNGVFDAECVSCHTTGFERISGWHPPN